MMSSDLSSKFPQISLNMRELSERKVYEFENFRLDADSLLLFRDGEQLPLTPKVVATLHALVERHGEIVTKDELMAAVWPDTQVEEGNLTQNLYLLRKALGNTSEGTPFIETLRRRGWRFSSDAARVGEVASSDGRHPAAQPVTVEKKANIYSVVDWQKSEPIEPEDRIEVSSAVASPPREKRSPGLIYALTAIAIVAAIGLVAFTIFKRSASREASDVRGEVSFTQLTDGRDVSYATVSPDGDYITYHETDGELSRMFVQQVGQTNRVEIAATTRLIYSKTFGPDGKSIYFAAADKSAKVASLYKVPTLGGAQTKILDDVGSVVAFSPDGSQIAFARSTADASHTEVLIANADGSAPHTIHVGHPTTYIWGGVAWSHDGKLIAFGEIDMRDPNASGKCTIYAIELPAGTVRELSREKWDGCGRMEFTFDNKGLVFTGTRKGESLTTGRDQVYYLSLDNGEARRLTNDGNRQEISSLGVTRSGDILVVPLNRSSQLWSMDANGKSETAHQITRGQADGRAGIAPLPDGRIGYTARAGDSLGVWIANGDGSGAKQIISDPPQIEEIRASADGKYFYFCSRSDGDPRLFRSATDGSDIKRILGDESFDVDSSISPDGNWIVYNSMVSDGNVVKRTLRLAPAAGGDSLQLTKAAEARNPHFSPDGKYVSFVNGETIGFVTVPNGDVVSTFTTRQEPLLNVGARWMPDGKALVYIVRQKSVGNLWKQPIDGSPAAPLTDFTSGEIYNFAFSSDGQRLILARGYPTRNAMLLKLR
jgi:Tol biopolymer transport system component/DNA-binding winged helix-turn-helix (wHTH) protein